jgi:electron transfer flavoprotein beta subunit
MNILVSLKVVPDYEHVRMAQGATSVDLKTVPKVAYTFDELALEAALRLKDADASNTLTVVSLTSDANAIKDVIKKALAVGADKAIVLEEPAMAEADTWAQAQILAGVVNKLGDVNLLMYGIQGIQGEAFPMGVEVAGLLDWPSVSYASDVKAAGNTVTVERHIEKGKQTVEVQTPAVVTIGKLPVDLRLPNFKGIMGAKNKPMDVWHLADIGLDAGTLTSSVRTLSIAPPPARLAGRKLEGDAADTAKEAVSALRGKKFV